MRVQRLVGIFGFACLCAVATLAVADDKKPETKKEEAPPMQAAKPGPEHAVLAKDVGKWKMVTKSMMDPTKAPEVSEGTVECKLICEGLFLQSSYHGEDPKGDFHGASMVGYDTKKKLYTGIWVDNMDTALYPYEGTCDANGKCVFTMEAMGPEGKPMKYKMISEHVDDDHRTFAMEMLGPDGKPHTIMEVDYTRM